MGMMIGYGNPLFEPGVQVSGGFGGQNLANLVDGRPGTLAQTNTVLNGTLFIAIWSRPIMPRIAAVINVSAPLGEKVDFLLKRAGDPSFTYITRSTEVVETATGDRCAFFVFEDGLDLCDGVAARFTDMQSPPDEPVLTCGQLWISEAAEYGLRPGFASGLTRSGEGVSVNGSLYTFPDSPRRTLDAEIVPQDYDSALLAQDSLQSVAVALSRDPRAVIIPDTDHIAATARYCRVTELGPITGLRNGPYFSMRLQAEEMVGNNGTI